MIENSLWTHWWSDADFVIRAVFLILISLSLLGGSVISFKLIQFRSVLRGELKLRAILRSGGSLESPFPKQALTAQFLQQHPEAHPVKMDRQAEQYLEEQRIELENGLILLAIIGNSAPFIGLLGTVWGIMHALQSLGGSALLTMDMVAGPVSEALVATAVGLFAAIPAAAAYNLLVRWLRRISSVMAGNLRALSDLLQAQRGNK